MIRDFFFPLLSMIFVELFVHFLLFGLVLFLFGLFLLLFGITFIVVISAPLFFLVFRVKNYVWRAKIIFEVMLRLQHCSQQILSDKLLLMNKKVILVLNPN